MSLPSYGEYKDSGITWLGSVPSHWQVMSIKRLSLVQRGASPRPIDDPKYFDDDGEYSWVRIADVSASNGVLMSTVQRMSGLGASLSVKIHPGDLFVSIAGTVGKPCISAIRACIHDGFVYFPTLGISPQFLYRIFEAGTCYAGLGKFGTQLNLNTDTIGSIAVAIPPVDEMQKILSFLDREITKIDALIAEQEKLITLLAEKRQATISHAVTRGLNPSVPMKDSGIPWIGKVPAHWIAKPLGAISEKIQTGPFGSQLHAEDYIEDGTPVINPSNLIGGKIMPDRKCTVSEEMVLSLSQHLLCEGDIVFGRRGEMGRCALVVRENVGWLCGTGSLNVRLKEGLAEFVVIYLSSPIVRESLRLESVGSTMDNLNADILSRIRVPLPPEEEQAGIVELVSLEAKRLDTLKFKAERAIALLKERRSALIAAAVTGQIDVRDAVSQERGLLA